MLKHRFELYNKALVAFIASSTGSIAGMLSAGTDVPNAILIGILTGVSSAAVVYQTPNRFHNENVNDIAFRIKEFN